jgi:hypothetical protein
MEFAGFFQTDSEECFFSADRWKASAGRSFEFGVDFTRGVDVVR